MEEEHTYQNIKEAVVSCDVNSQYEIPFDSTSGNVYTSATPHQDKFKLKKPVCSWLWMCALVGFILVGSAAFASLVLTVWNIVQVNHQSAKLERERMIMQLQNTISGLENSVNNSVSEYERKIKQFQISQASVSRSLKIRIDDILLQLNPAASCFHVLQLNSSSPSGHYWIRSFNGFAVRVYCDFNRKCGCDGSSTWTRVTFLNMSDPHQICPSNWTTITSPLRTCGRGQNRNGSCKSTFYSTFGLTYSRVCGRIIAYQDRNTDGFVGLVFASRQIEGPYVDGVSLTHGSEGSREHIWSFASAIGERGSFRTAWLCECSNSSNWPHSTAFVGNDYFCDSGNHGRSIPNIFFSDDPLWDGQGCGPSSTCCQFNNPPWFCKTLPHSTTDDLEVRICNHESFDDTPIQLLELYVQ